MSCSIYQKLTMLHAGRELPGALLSKLDRHVDGCSVCALKLQAVVKDRERIAQSHEAVLEAEPTPEMGERFWLSIRRELRTEGLVGDRAAARKQAGRRLAIDPLLQPRGPSLGILTRGLAAAAVILVAGLLYGPWQEPDHPLSQPGAESAPVAGLERPATQTVVRVRGIDGGLERVSTTGNRHGWVDPVEPFGRPAVEYQLEGWKVPGPEREVLDF